MKQFKSDKEVLQLWEQEKQEIILYNGVVYDVNNFKMEHPGGNKTIEAEFGKNIEEPFEEEGHSKKARMMIKTLPIVGYIQGTKSDEEIKELEALFVSSN